MFYGLCDLPWWGNLLVLLGMTQITIAAVTIFLHRNQAHRALTLHPSISHFFRMWLWLTTGMETKKWAAIHRKHHAKCETADDPHSPQVMGLPLVLWNGAELYRKEGANPETIARYGQGTPEDWMEKHVYTHSRYGIGLMFIIDLILFGVPGITIWAIQMMWIPFFAAGFVNGVGHYWGYRNFECPDQARNVSPWGIFIGGEELHNNHHTYPTSAKLSVKWWEIDMGWVYIRLLEMLGLAKAKRTPPLPCLAPEKTHIDMETLKAIIINRFHVMAQFTKKIILPLPVDKENKTLLVRESSLLDNQAKQRLQAFLAHNKSVSEIYQFKERLQMLWTSTVHKENELLEALQKWCSEAEATGNHMLKEFALYLKRFTLKAA